jgi:hypothetical protein
MKILKNGRIFYPNLIEGLFFSPSHHSIGIQFADLISGAIFRNYEKQDDRWYKIIRKKLWEPKPELSGSQMSKLGLISENERR